MTAASDPKLVPQALDGGGPAAHELADGTLIEQREGRRPGSAGAGSS